MNYHGRQGYPAAGATAGAAAVSSRLPLFGFSELQNQRKESHMKQLEGKVAVVGVHLISVSKVTVRFPSNGAGMGR